MVLEVCCARCVDKVVRSTPPSRLAFTLIELLVVIAIIAALTDGSGQQYTQSALKEHLGSAGDENFRNCILKP